LLRIIIDRIKIGGTKLQHINRSAVYFLYISSMLMMLSIALMLLFVPEVKSGFAAPVVQRIFYVHLPSAIMSYVAFTVVFTASIIFLKNQNYKWDIIAASSAQIGLVFCTLALITGALWGKAEWDAYWRWEDIRLVTFLILWLIFSSYIGLRNAVDEPEKRGRLSSVFGIIGFIGVPMSYFSMYIWQTLHPKVISPGGGGLSAEMGITLLISFFTFLILYAFILLLKVNISSMEQKVEQLKDLIEGSENDQ
jgi:heme exporter protein C